MPLSRETQERHDAIMYRIAITPMDEVYDGRTGERLETGTKSENPAREDDAGSTIADAGDGQDGGKATEWAWKPRPESRPKPKPVERDDQLTLF